MSHRTRSLFSLLAALLLSVVASSASAQANVTVHVRTADGSAGEARVTFSAENGGQERSCQTRNGTCSITGMTAGRYVVTATPIASGNPPIPRPVMIPPAGDVTVSVTLR